MMDSSEVVVAAKAFMEKYGDVAFVHLPHFRKIVEARGAALALAEAIGEKVTPPAGPDETLLSIVERAAKAGDVAAKLLIASGALQLL